MYQKRTDDEWRAYEYCTRTLAGVELDSSTVQRNRNDAGADPDESGAKIEV